ncbi:MAG: aerobic carbon-monoxide dehydrogenase small subunit [Chloroflexota bacterium]|jgi:carbon-monoxide dehydrogenase small subunit|nr:aerobic carbon-monoxide dehydrogenase small subunit [Chloroflexota bacterium]
MTEPYPIQVTVNGRMRTARVAPHHTLLEVLRDDLGLTGSKECCLVGECGACTVMLDGRSVDSCLVLAAEADGGEVLTVEGLAADGRLTALQEAFLEYGAAQCGFCIPGQLLSAHALLTTHEHPTRADVEEGLAGNLCRCAGYQQIIEAVLAAAGAGAAGGTEGRRRDGAQDGPVPSAHSDRPDPAATPDAQVAPQ